MWRSANVEEEAYGCSHIERPGNQRLKFKVSYIKKEISNKKDISSFPTFLPFPYNVKKAVALLEYRSKDSFIRLLAVDFLTTVRDKKDPEF